MAITSGDAYIAASKQIIPYTKTTSNSTVSLTRFGLFATAGNPPAGTLARTTATTGEVLTSATAGCPLINTFGGGNTGYLTRVSYSSTVSGRLELWDKLFAINVSLLTLATTTLASQADYSGRLPNTSYAGLRIFLEITTAVSATATTVSVNYTSDTGVAGRTTGASASLSGFTVNRWVEMPLQSGDSGVQKIESVTVGGTVATTGAVNIIVCRGLWSNRFNVANMSGLDGIDRTGMPIVYSTSALVLTTVADSTVSGVPDLNIEISNG